MASARGAGGWAGLKVVGGRGRPGASDASDRAARSQEVSGGMTASRQRPPRSPALRRLPRPPSRPRGAPRASQCHPLQAPASPSRTSPTRKPGTWEVRLRRGRREGTPGRDGEDAGQEGTCWVQRPCAHFLSSESKLSFQTGKLRFEEGGSQPGRSIPATLVRGAPPCLLGRCSVPDTADLGPPWARA